MNEELTFVNLYEPQSPEARRVRKPAAEIIREVAAAHHVRVDNITGPSRDRSVVRARCEAMRKVAAEWDWLSYPAIGRLFNRDHTTVMHHVVKAGGKHTRQLCTCDQGEKRRSPSKGGAE